MIEFLFGVVSGAAIALKAKELLCVAGTSSDEPMPLVKGGWYPKASNPAPPPPAPPPPPYGRPVPPANLRIKSGVIPTAEEVLTRPPVSRPPETRESLREARASLRGE